MAQFQPVSLTDQSINLSRKETVKSFQSFSVQPNGLWLSTTNPYLAGGSKQLKVDCKAGLAIYDNVASYVAASAFVHSADAWSYLGRAVDALLRGDVSASIHLTYYAELRAAKSILASEGIIVGNRYSAQLGPQSTVIQINASSTHDAAWEIFQDWAGLPSTFDTVSRIFAPGGTELHSWVSSIPAGVHAVIEDLLKTVGFDLQTFKEDRERRNLASYEPTTLADESISVGEVAKTVAALWADVEPAVGGDFPGVDRLVLANVLLNQYSAQHTHPDPATPDAEIVNWSDWSSWLESLTPARTDLTSLQAWLRDAPLSAEVRARVGLAFDTPASTRPRDFIGPMIGRATVLLRLATGMCTSLLFDAGKTGKDIEPWLDIFVRSRGIWGSEDLPKPRLELFEDVVFPRDTLEISNATTFRDFHDDLREGMTTLGQTERILSWSLT